MKKLLLSILFLLIAGPAIVGQTRKDSLLVFVGEKIDFQTISQGPARGPVDTIIEGRDTSYSQMQYISMDQGVRARYKVLKQVYGSFKADTIEFVAYDHFGTPPFLKYKHTLLFVENVKGKLYHVKYVFDDVYKTKNGRWAGGYNAFDYTHEYNKNTPVKPVAINFIKEVSYNIQKRSKEDIAHWFPAPYYTIKNGKAIVVLGNYVEELFTLRRDGILKTRGIF